MTDIGVTLPYTNAFLVPVPFTCLVIVIGPGLVRKLLIATKL